MVAVALPLIPLILVVEAAISLESARWWRLFGVWDSTESWLEIFDGRVWRLFFNTLWLAFLTAVFAMLLALPPAIIVARYQFFGRQWLSRLLVLPVAIPPYLFAIIYSDLNRQAILPSLGWSLEVRDVFNLLHALINPITPSGLAPSNGVYGLTSAALILALAGYPYLFLLLKQRLQRENSHWRDSARLLNVSPSIRFWRIALPWFRPALIAGLTVILLHVLADYGAVKVLRVETFTKSIFKYITELHQYSMAAALSVILLGLGSAVVAFGWLGQQQRSAKDAQRDYPRQKLIGFKLLLAYVLLVLILLPAVVVPLGWLGYWTYAELQSSFDIAFAVELLEHTGASVGFAAAATVLAMLAGFALSYYRWVHEGQSARHLRARYFAGHWGSTFNRYTSRMLVSLGTVGFVLPGPIVALGLLLVASWLVVPESLQMVFSYMLFAVALAVRYLPIAVQGEQAALAGFSPRLLEAAQLQGVGRFATLRRVLLPAIRPSLLAAGVLTAIEILKDLPIALVIRPLKIDTLPMDIWNEIDQESLELAAPAALMLVVLSLPLVFILDRRGRTGQG